MRVLGIDPGTTRVGYGVIETLPKLHLITYGVLEISAHDYSERILELAQKISRLLTEHSPGCAGVEELLFSKNKKTALSVSEARGIIVLLLLQKKIPVLSLYPNDVKLSVSGYGGADKKTVAKMVGRILGIDAVAGHDDASDALAIALTAAQRYALDERINRNIIG